MVPRPQQHRGKLDWRFRMVYGWPAGEWHIVSGRTLGSWFQQRRGQCCGGASRVCNNTCLRNIGNNNSTFRRWRHRYNTCVKCVDVIVIFQQGFLVFPGQVENMLHGDREREQPDEHGQPRQTLRHTICSLWFSVNLCSFQIYISVWWWLWGDHLHRITAKSAPFSIKSFGRSPEPNPGCPT